MINWWVFIFISHQLSLQENGSVTIRIQGWICLQVFLEGRDHIWESGFDCTSHQFWPFSFSKLILSYSVAECGHDNVPLFCSVGIQPCILDSCIFCELDPLLEVDSLLRIRISCDPSLLDDTCTRDEIQEIVSSGRLNIFKLSGWCSFVWICSVSSCLFLVSNCRYRKK